MDKLHRTCANDVKAQVNDRGVGKEEIRQQDVRVGVYSKPSTVTRPQRQPKSPEKNERRTKSRRGQTPQKVEERSKAPQMPLPLPPIHAPAISGK